MKAKYIYLTIAVFISSLGQAQLLPEIETDTIIRALASSSIDMPQIIPASPKVSSITKFGEYPVSLYTGLVDITVPVYTIKVRDIEVPIEFKYHASGIKYDDVSLEAGLGWSLVAGGIIDYYARGSKDNEYGSSNVFIKNINNINQAGNCNNDDLRGLMSIVNGNKLYNSAEDKRDGETDIYTYSFLQYSGQFCRPYPNTGPDLPYLSNGTVFIPANPLRWESLSPFVLSDDRGISYTFEIMEPINNYGRHTAYYLTKIISADKVDTVSFNYTYYSPASPNLIIRPHINRVTTLIEKSPIFVYHWGSFGSSEVLYSGGYTYVEYYPGRLNSITFRGGRVTFEYFNNIATSRDLRTIKVYDNLSPSPLQTISLIKSQFAGGRGERLDQVVFQNQQNDTYSYQFGYNGDPGTNPGGIDYWGYYNGKSVNYNADFVPNFTVNRLDYPSGFQVGTLDRSANESYMNKGILNKIIYPTKGYTEFNYEAHKASNITFGGLRIKEIHNYNSDGTLAEKKWYKYGAGESGQGVAAAYPLADDFTTFSRTLEEYCDFISPWSYLGRVIDLRQFMSFPKQSYFTSGSSVVYAQVTEYTGNGITDTGKTVYSFEHFPAETGAHEAVASASLHSYRAVDMPVRTFTWKNGKLLSKIVYKKENNIYTTVYTLENSYKDINTSEYMNLRVLPYISFDRFDLELGFGGGDDYMYYCYDNPYNYYHYESRSYFGGNTPFDYYNYYITTGLRVLNYSTETTDGVTKYVYYDTYNTSGFPAQVRTISSSGKTLQTTYKYPADLTGTAVFNNMVSRNMLSPVVETKETVDNSFTTFRRTQFGMNHPNNANLIAPIAEDYQTVNQGAPETRITYNRYDSKGNPVHIVRDNADQVVYLWGYNHRYPIAEITGVPYSDVTNIISEATLNTIAAKNEPAAPDLTSINNLRAQLPKAQVTTYTYKPLVGIEKMTDPREVVTNYEYDSFGRLKKVTQAGRVIESYDYHYKN